MRLLLSLAGLAAAVGALLTVPRPAAAQPPVVNRVPPPPEFSQPQSAPKPAPFAVSMVDQGQFDPRLKGYFLPDGFRLEIVLSEPDVVNPVGMTFAPDGSLFVMEWRPDPVTRDRWFPVVETFRYRDGTTREITTMKKFTTDLVKHFTPNTKTGKFDPPRTILSEELPSSILWHDGWLYVTGRGTVRRWRQATAGNISGVDTSRAPNPSDPWNIREVVAQGFCGFHHHQVSGLTIGNDGLLYLTSGDDDNYVEGSDGSRATVLRTGAVFRCRPDGSRMETFSIGYRNPYRDLAYDGAFNWFHADNDNEDGSKFMGCRIMHVAEAADFGWRLRYGARCCRPDEARVSVAGELPGTLPPMIKTGRGSPAGLLIYNDTRIPTQYRGLLYYPDVYRRVVRAYRTVPTGSTFQITGEFEFLKSDDPLFRPCQMVTGPDGAMYVCDWRTDSGGAGKLSGDGVNGRVYRIRWAGNAATPELPLRGTDSWAKVKALPDAALVDALGLPDLTDRVEARKELVRRGAKARDLVLSRFKTDQIQGDARLVGLGVLSAGWNADVEDVFRKLLVDESPDVRRLAVDGLALNAPKGDARTFEVLLVALSDSDQTVRRAAALGLGRVGVPAAAEALLAAWRTDEAADVYLRDAHVRGVERLGKAGVDALLTLAQSGDNEFKAAVEIMLTLRSREAAAGLPDLLATPHATPAQREALVRSYTNYQLDPPVSLDPLVDYLRTRRDEAPAVVAAAAEVFAASDGNLSPKGRAFVAGLLDHRAPTVRAAGVSAVEATRLVSAAPKLIEALGQADRAPAERVGLVKALRVLGAKDAVAPMTSILTGANPPALKLEAIRTLAALDAKAAQLVAEAMLDQPDPTLQTEAVVILGATKAGAKLVGERYVAKKLPRELFPQVSDALRRFTTDDPAVSQLLAEVMRGGLLLSMEPTQVERIRGLVATRGSAARGRELFLNTRLLNCATCHRMEGVGGGTGPDLTRLWDTHTLEKILEAIADPSKEIKEGFQAYRVVGADGQVHTGLKVSETATELVMRDANGRDLRLAKSDIESVTPSRLSLMPDNTVSPLSFDQFIDLLAFLKNRPEQELLRGVTVEGSVVSGFSANLGVARAEVTADPASKATKWEPARADTNGLFDLKAVFPTTDPGGVYVRTFVYSPKEQAATGIVLADDPVRIWVGDRSAFDRPGAPVTAVEETFPVALKAGWNAVLVKVGNGGRGHRLGLRFSGDGVRTAGLPQ
ncbi:PVC-type heme-binding CxxCH protein [Urbifossiella limnaea]|uniref:Cytochrome c n=1 Tax=Urbifossiella limnaea TaxID=2528023 RepID=A0A517XX70_9BACT|nr:PVC-type heme-binding CxxCH protein [Urbifossiella limnaea]QDU22112.1 Cytochrome c [Urbifossiella limnaea]